MGSQTCRTQHTLPVRDCAAYATLHGNLTCVAEAAVIGGVASMFACLFYRLFMQDMEIKQQFKIAAAFRLFPGLVEICKQRPAHAPRPSLTRGQALRGGTTWRLASVTKRPFTLPTLLFPQPR